MHKTIKDCLVITVCCLSLTLLVWLPHLLSLPNFFGLNFSNGFNTIFRNFDGLEYVIIAKSLYDPKIIATLPQSLADTYYAAHFPGYSLLILFFAPFLGFLTTMLFVSLLFTILSSLMFYKFVKDFKFSESPLTLSLIFLILPARWLIVHSVGSSEPMFIFFVLASLYCFLTYELVDKWSWIAYASIFGSLAILTRPPGILLFISLVVFFHLKVWAKLQQNQIGEALKIHLKYLPLLLIPTTLIGIFFWYQIAYHDFFAYFHSGDNIHLTFPPFQVFNKSQPWVGDIWLEDIVYIFILGYLAGIKLLKSPLTKPLGFFVLTYMVAGSLVAHRDVSRYLLPIFPFVLIAYQKVLTSKEFRVVLIIVALGIYLYAQNFILNNTAPFPELSYFD